MSITRDFVHSTLGISEAWELPKVLLSVMLDDVRRESILSQFAGAMDDLTHDNLTDYFQDEHGDRDALKQDFTPMALCDLVAEMAGDAESYLDVCAGTGGLTISLWARHPDAMFRCEEFSARTVPALLLNLAIRNARAEVVRRDVLTGETFACYALEPGERFSRVSVVDSFCDRRWDVCVQNPPYSLKWDGMARPWMRYGAPPKSKADWAFVQYGLAHANRVVSILPHGVLFRGAAEGRIREAFLKDGRIRSITGLPDKLFLHTGIPVCVLEVTRDANDSICVVNADELCEKRSKQNVMLPDHVRDILSCLSMRRDVDRLCHVAGMSEIERNGYNLNIPRYVDRYVEPEIPDVGALLSELCDIDKDIRKTERSILAQIKSLVGTTDEARREVDMLQSRMTQYVEGKGGQLAWQI